MALRNSHPTVWYLSPLVHFDHSCCQVTFQRQMQGQHQKKGQQLLQLNITKGGNILHLRANRATSSSESFLPCFLLGVWDSCTQGKHSQTGTRGTCHGCFLSLEGLRKGFCGCKEGFFPPSSLQSNVISSLDFWAESLHSNNMCFNWLQLLNPSAYEHMVQDITDPWNVKFNHSSLLMQETWPRHWEEEWWGGYAQFAYNRL